MNIDKLLADSWAYNLSFVDKDAANLISQLGLSLILGSLLTGKLALFSPFLGRNFPLLYCFGLVFDSLSSRLNCLSMSLGSSLDTKFDQFVGHGDSIFTIFNKLLPLIDEPWKYLLLHRSL